MYIYGYILCMFQIIQYSGALAAWASTARSPWKGRLGSMNYYSGFVQRRLF